MPPYRCRSHDRSDCRDAVCRRQAERAGFVAPRANRTAGGDIGPDEAAAVSRARTGELWVGPARAAHGTDGPGSLAHLPGGVCVHYGEKPDDTGLYEGWGRILDVPNALGNLVNGKPVPATDDSGLVAVRICSSCRTLLD